MKSTLTSNVEEKAGTTAVSKLLALPAAAETENFQNWSLLYWGPIREDTIGKALETQMVNNQELNYRDKPVKGSIRSRIDEELICQGGSIACAWHFKDL